MPIEEIDKKRPICDTDIWIKSCKHKEIYQEELIFDVYDKIFMSDAVRQELGRIRESKEPFNGFASIKTIKNIDVNSDYEDEYKKDFELGLRYFSEENGKRLNIIQSHNEKFFNEKESKALEKEFLEICKFEINKIQEEIKENERILSRYGLAIEKLKNTENLVKMLD